MTREEPVQTCWACRGATTWSPSLGDLGFLSCTVCDLQMRGEQEAAQVERIYTDAAYSSTHGNDYLTELPSRLSDADVRVALVKRFVERGSVLDVGAASGAFVARAGEAGFDAEGIEPTPTFASFARTTLGVAVRDGTLDDVDPQAEYDVATMWHVLEHIVDPVDQLAGLRDALKPGGHLVIEVPNARSESARSLTTRWPSLQPTVHVGQYGPDSLGRLLRGAGFEVKRVWTVPFGAYVPHRARLRPRQLLNELRTIRSTRTLRREHPDRHQLLRAVAVRPRP